MKTKHWSLFLLLAALLVLPLAGCQQPAEDAEETAADTETEMTTEAPGEVAEAEELAALAALQGAADTQVDGTVRFTQSDGAVTVTAELTGVEPAGLHGLHIHETGDCSAADFTSAGGHYDPEGVDHACPPTAPRHAGDLGNIEVADDGSASLTLTSDLISLRQADAHSILGKAVILHSGEDDCQTQPTGDAGSRLACGVIALSNPAAEDVIEVEPEGEMDDAMDDGMEEGGAGS